ncbi:MAG: restriction endonuclease subunit S [Ardenticatenaceae bacterium]|nr:restriction endonuclease subunit S [Ardenticatenaceae bacterium]
MTLEMLLARFDGLIQTSADVEKLNATILQWAVQGRLMPQCADDEPAIVLLGQIAIEKKRLAQKKVIKKSKALPRLNQFSQDYLLPTSWFWTHVDDVSLLVTDGEHATPPRVDHEAIPLVTAKNVRDGYLDLSNTDYVTLDTAIRSWQRCNPQHDDLLVVCVGATTGRASLAKFPPDMVLVRSVALIRPHPATIYPEFLEIFIKSPLGQKQIWNQVKQTAQPVLYLNRIKKMRLPLPPLAEQKRIVARVDELLGQTAVLAQQLEAVNEQRRGLNTAVLHQLTQSSNAATVFPLIQRHFDRLYVDADTIAELKQAILQLAVQGRLVPQDDRDENAAALIESIAVKKVSLMDEGRLRKTKRIANVQKSEIPYFLPEGWVWCRWDHVSLLIGDVDHKMPKEVAEGIPYISPRDFVNENEIDFENAKKISPEDFERLVQKIQPEYGDIIFPRYGTIGVNRFVKTHIDFLASYSCAIVKTMHDYIEPRYSFFYSLSPLVQSEIERYTNKTTQPNVGIGSIKKFLFPLPPLSEQKRIVAKVDELFALCDQLVGQLITAENGRVQLLDAVLAQAT